MSPQVLLSRVPVLADQLGEQHALALLERGALLEIAAGTVLVHDQGAIDALYLLISGTLRLSIEVPGHALVYGEIGPGNWVGEVALFSASPTAVSNVTALTQATLVRLGYAQFHALRVSDPSAACHLTHLLIAMMVRRLRATANDPVLAPEGQLMLLGDLNLPPEQLHGHRQNLLAALKSLLGLH